jgi:glutaredoxin
VPKVIKLTLFSKPGCHLCEEAKLVIETVIAQFRSVHSGVSASVQVQLEEKNILEDEELAKLYAEEIPVLQLNGETHGYWRIDPIRLMAALEDLYF